MSDLNSQQITLYLSFFIHLFFFSTFSCLQFPTIQCLLSQVFLYSYLCLFISLWSKKAMIPPDLYLLNAMKLKINSSPCNNTIGASSPCFKIIASPSLFLNPEKEGKERKKKYTTRYYRSNLKIWVLAFLGNFLCFSCVFSSTQVIFIFIFLSSFLPP